MSDEKKSGRISGAVKRVCGGISTASGMVILVVSLLVFIYLAMQSLLNTTIMENAPDDPSTVFFTADNFYINLGVIFIVFLLGTLFLKKLMTKINPKIFGTVLILYVFVLSIAWNIMAKVMPLHDSWCVMESAKMFSRNDMSPINEAGGFYNYYLYYPFQLGYAFFCEIMFRIFGENAYLAVQLFNSLCASALCAALMIIAKLAFNSRAVTNFTIFFMFGCVQLILFTSFHYGNLPGFAFSMWAVVFTCLFIKKRSWYYIPLTAVFISVGISLKKNSLIVLVAICIILLLDILKKFSVKAVAAVAASVVVGLGLNRVIIFQYENRADCSVSDGIPMVLWLDMGIHESENPNRPGWYNPNFTLLTYESTNFDGEKASEIGIRDIKERVGELLKYDSERAGFFTRKTLSQWNDPLYMSIWVNETRYPKEETGAFVNSMYNGNVKNAVTNFANIYQSLLFVFAVAGAVLILAVKELRRNIYCWVLPLVFLGGFFYHLLFEAMPQYNLVYFILFIPPAAFGFSKVCGHFEESFKTFVKIYSEDSEKRTKKSASEQNKLTP